LNREKQELKRLLKEDVEEVNTANVPLLSLQMNIDESLKELRRKLEERYKEIEELRSESVSLCATMDEVPRPIVKDPLPSERELEGYRTYLDELRDQQFNRYGKILEYRDQIKNIMQKLEITSISEYDNNLLHSNELKPTILNIEKLEQLHETCVDTFERMEYQIKDFRKRLAQLWKYLDVSESHQQKFEKCSETSQTNFDILANEVKRCEQIKRENIKVFIERVRAEIEEYWNKCLKSEAERMLFKSFNTNIFNEDVLELHEDELRDLKQFYENNEPIFKLINERNDLWNQLEVLQNKEQDPKRYNNRGGQLLKEEKERKMLTLKLPKVVDKLTLIANQYEEVNGRPFTVYGVRVQDMIEKDYETKRQEKLTKSGKKVFPTPLKGTASRGNLTHMRTPLTVEQTLMANRNGLKSTGGRLVAMSRTNLCTTTSSTSSIASTRTDHGKRKFVNSKTPGPPAKRQLQLSPLKTQPPSRVLQPHSENRREVNEKSTVRKPTTIRVYNTGSLVKRKSISRKSIGKKNRRSNSIKLKSKPRPKIPEIVLSDHESENIIHLTDENATSYEGFEVSL
jgi:Ase1/PRC1/MAP65 family protein